MTKWTPTLKAVVIIDLAICAVVGLALWVTKSLWALIGLLFLMAYESKRDKVRGKCPKCGEIVELEVREG